MDIRETLNRQDYTKLDEFSKQLEGFEPVSYTHLTLPTIA